jgi:hypothetical protein
LGRKKLVSIREFARQRKVNESTIRKHIKRGLIQLHGRGKGKGIDPAEASARLAKNIDPTRMQAGNAKLAKTGPAMAAAQPLEQSPKILNLFEAREERARFQAKREELAAEKEKIELESLKGKFIAADQAGKILSKAVIVIRQKILAIPSKAAPQLRMATTTQECRELLEAFIHDALRELARCRIPRSLTQHLA